MAADCTAEHQLEWTRIGYQSRPGRAANSRAGSRFRADPWVSVPRDLRVTRCVLYAMAHPRPAGLIPGRPPWDPLSPVGGVDRQSEPSSPIPRCPINRSPADDIPGHSIQPPIAFLRATASFAQDDVPVERSGSGAGRIRRRTQQGYGTVSR